MGVSAAVLVVGAATAAIQSSNANRASKSQMAAYDRGAQRLEQMKNNAIERLAPYRTAGETALGPLSGLVTGKQYDSSTGQTRDISEQERNSLFQKSPGYQFRLDQAQSALEKTQAARGNLLSGGAVKEAQDRAQGVASDEYSNYINQLTSLATMGQNAATASGGFELGIASPLANMVTNQGLAQANGYTQQSNIIGGSLSQTAQLAALAYSKGGGGGAAGSMGSAGGSSNAFMNSGSSMMQPNTSLQYQSQTLGGY